jgi:hypothetical protein
MSIFNITANSFGHFLRVFEARLPAGRMPGFGFV